MNAREKFQLRDMVSATSYARAMLSLDVGLVVGFSTKREDCVRVLPGNHKAPRVFHMDFWEVDNTVPA